MRRAVPLAALILESVVATAGRAGAPPLLTRHPLSQRVQAGHATRLIGGSNDPLAAYAWELESRPLAGFVSTELTFLHALPQVTGSYQLIARNSRSLPGLPLIGESASRAARLSVIVPPEIPGVVDLAFGDPALSGGDVRGFVPTPDGGGLVVGSFSAAGPLQAGGLLRLRGDGSPSPDFQSLPGAQGGRIRAVTPHLDGWIVGGDFTSFHGVAVARLARLTGDGKLDSSFRPPSVASTVRTVATQTLDGETYVLAGLSASPWLVRWHADGRHDTAFASQLAAAGLNGRVSALAVQPDGSIILGGMFFQDTRWPFRRIARIKPGGQPDIAGFRGGAGTGADGEILALGIDALGKILVGGAFTAIHGQNIRYCTRLTPTGDIDPSFVAGPDDFVHALLVLRTGDTLIAGPFRRVNGVPVPTVARLLPQGVPDPAWQPASFDGTATSVSIGPGDRVFVGGEFRQPHRGLAALRGTAWTTSPRFLTDPPDHEITDGQGGSLLVAAQAGPDSAYVWHKLGTPRPAAVTATGEWIIPRATAELAGSYEVEIISPQASVRSSPFLVRVPPASPGDRPHWRGLPEGPLGDVPDQGELTVPITLAALHAEEIHVTLALNHRDTNDLIIELRSPTGKIVRLVDPDEPSALRSGQNFDFTVFADAATEIINEAAAPYRGTFRPSAEPPALAGLRGPHPQGPWTLSVTDSRDDGVRGELRFIALDIFGPRPAIDDQFLATWLLSTGQQELVIEPSRRQVVFRHWQPITGPAPAYEYAQSLSNWTSVPPDQLLRQRRHDDQSAAAWLGWPDSGPASAGFFRARW
ncbi:MAG: delta-60 repeat domain-containing protein [Verrucomicrobiales bacterium]